MSYPQGAGAALLSGGDSHCAYCAGFMDIPMLVRGKDGRQYINPDADMIKTFRLGATPFGGAQGTVGPGNSQIFALTVPAEENHLGDLLINELLARFTPTPGAAPVLNIQCEFLNFQNDRLFMNTGVFNTLLWGNAQLNCCLPCCFLLQATNTMQIRVTNTDTVNSVACEFVARGKRFLPYHDPELRNRMLSYWNTIPTTPYWLTLDDGEVQVAAGQTQTFFMTVPGGGDFEYQGARCEVFGVGGAATADDIDVSVAEGIGRQWSDVPMNLGAFVATPTIAVAGFPNGGTYAAASACHCTQYRQLFKRNTRIRVTFTNNAAVPAIIRFTFPGCMHYTGECPPGRDLDRLRSLEPTVGPLLTQSYRCPPWQEVQPEPGRGLVPITSQSAPALPRPAHGPATSYWRPPGAYYGPGSSGLPHNWRFAQDQQGNRWTEEFDPRTQALVREIPGSLVPAAGGMAGLGRHDWGRI